MIVTAIRAGIKAIKFVKSKAGDYVTLQRLNEANKDDSIHFLAYANVHVGSAHSMKLSGRPSIVQGIVDTVKASFVDQNRKILVIQDTTANELLLLLFKESEVNPDETMPEPFPEETKNSILSSITENGFALFGGVTIINLTQLGKSSGPVLKQLGPHSFQLTPAGQRGLVTAHTTLDFPTTSTAPDDIAAVNYFASIASK